MLWHVVSIPFGSSSTKTRRRGVRSSLQPQASTEHSTQPSSSMHISSTQHAPVICTLGISWSLLVSCGNSLYCSPHPQPTHAHALPCTSSQQRRHNPTQQALSLTRPSSVFTVTATTSLQPGEGSFTNWEHSGTKKNDACFCSTRYTRECTRYNQ